MKPNYSQKEFNECKSVNKLPLICYNCSEEFYLTKRRIQSTIKGSGPDCGKYCSQICNGKTKITKSNLNCTHCNKNFYKRPSEIKKSKSGNHFCSRSCSGTYNNLHKKTGTRRSKLEVWLEEQLDALYPNFDIKYNDKTAINSELDIFIPSLSLAIELNGIYHYEPIHGLDKLAQIQNNDVNKFQACIKNSISLCIIDSSSLKYFKPSNAQKYLDIIVNTIDSNINNQLAEQ